MRKRSWVGALAVCMLLLPAQASADELAASCPGPPDDGVTNTQPGPTQVAETFTSAVTGELTRAEVAINKSGGSTGDYILRINEVSPTGVPTNTVLAAAAVANATVPDGPSMLGATFAPGTNIAAGVAYAIVVTRPTATLFTLRNRDANPCSSTGLFFSASQSDPFGPASGTRDMVFSVFAEPTPAAPPDATPPGTTIMKSPKDKTKKKTATFEFTGADARAVVGFECSIDGGAFSTCTSPHTVKVKKGKHTFEVRAIDQAGNVGTPASDHWKVKKKRKK